jgi:trk system potassium uptake protein TrkA
MYVIIIGCGRVGSELAKLLSSEGHNVVVIDKNPRSFQRLGSAFNGLTITGDGCDSQVLKEAGIEKADAFCTVTDGDNTNIMAAQIGKKIFRVPKVITRIYDPLRANIYKQLGLDTISGSLLLAAMIRDKIIESHFSSYLLESKDLGVLEVKVEEALVGKKAGEINIPEEAQIVALIRKHDTLIPRPELVLLKGDILLVVVKIASLDKVRYLLAQNHKKE